MRTMKKQAELIGTIESLLQSVDVPEKRAESNTEAGGYQGASTHPVTKVDDRTDDAVEGARSKENTEDVKDEPNRGKTVDETKPGPGAGQDSVQTNIGITSKATGEDSGAETDSTKPGKEDGGTFQGSSTHPARTDNDQIDGHKWSADIRSLRQLCKQAEDIGNDLCATIAAQADTTIKKRAEQMTTISLNSAGDSTASGQKDPKAGGITGPDGAPITNDKVDSKVNAKKSADQAAQAGYDLAGVFADFDIGTEDKQAADAMVIDTIGNIILTAHRRAEKCAAFYQAHFDPRNQKVAEGEEPPMDAAPSDGGEAPAEGGGGPDEAALLELLQGGEGMGGEEALGGMAGGGEGGGDPAAGGEGGGEGDLAALEQVLQELGITPEELEQMIMEQQAGGGGGDPMAGGGDPMAAAGGAGGAGGGDPMAAMAGGAGGAGGMGGGAPVAKAAAARRPIQKKAVDRRKVAAMHSVVREIVARSQS